MRNLQSTGLLLFNNVKSPSPYCCHHSHSPLISYRFYSTPMMGTLTSGYTYSIIPKMERDNGFDIAWREMPEEQKEVLMKQYAQLERQDWRTLNLEQKRAIYTVAYGPPPIIDRYENYKVFFGVCGVIAFGIGLFAFARSKANPPPRTLTPEYKRAMEEYVRRHNINPISRHGKEESVDTVRID